MITKLKTTINTILAVALMLFILPMTASAAVPFPGKLSADIVNIEAANIINVSIETWPGFRRNIRIILPHIVVPGQTEDPSECELELGDKALEFTVNFLSEAEGVSVMDMMMEHSASEYAISSIHTNAGTLDNALRRERLVRLNTVAPDTPWCQ